MRKRITVIDVLRGFALMMIVFIHFVEHFDFFKKPVYHFLFSDKTDGVVMESTFFLISGKAYSIFALLFGLSFFIQMDTKKQKGIDYRRGFLWRMSILFIIGFFHSLLYRGDILHTYAVCSLIIILLYKVKTKYLWIISIVLLMQIPTLYELVTSFFASDYDYTPLVNGYFEEGESVYAEGNLLDVMGYNLWKGRVTVWAWFISVGKFSQLLALFILGMILGRSRWLEDSKAFRKESKMLIIFGVVASVLVYVTKLLIKDSTLSDLQISFLGNILNSFHNVFLIMVVVFSIIWIYHNHNKLLFFKLLASFGRMSLTNYIANVVLGTCLFYGFGFGLYSYLGTTWSLCVGFLVFLLQLIMSFYWLKNFYYGPVEWFWRCCTKLDFSVPFRK